MNNFRFGEHRNFLNDSREPFYFDVIVSDGEPDIGNLSFEELSSAYMSGKLPIANIYIGDGKIISAPLTSVGEALEFIGPTYDDGITHVVLSISADKTLYNEVEIGDESSEWSAITLASGVEAGTIGGSTTPYIRRVGKRVDIIGSVKVTWNGTTPVDIAVLDNEFIGGGYQTTWLSTGARSAGRIVNALISISNTGAGKGTMRIIAIQDSSGTNITIQHEVIISNSYYIV